MRNFFILTFTALFATTAMATEKLGDPRKIGIDVVQNRVFRTEGRAELSLGGGFIFDDTFVNYQLLEAKLTYHIKETFAIEASFAHALHQDKGIIKDLQGIQCPPNQFFDSNGQPLSGCGVFLDPAPDPYKNIYFGNLVWTPIYGKFVVFSQNITHFGFYALAGAGFFDQTRKDNFGFNMGLGIKAYLNDWMGLRLEAKNFTIRQNAPFNHIVNNRIFSANMSFFLPTHSKKQD